MIWDNTSVGRPISEYAGRAGDRAMTHTAPAANSKTMAAHSARHAMKFGGEDEASGGVAAAIGDAGACARVDVQSPHEDACINSRRASIQKFDIFVATRKFDIFFAARAVTQCCDRGTVSSSRQLAALGEEDIRR